MKAMKAMKAKKAMKAARSHKAMKSHRSSKTATGIRARLVVFNGTAEKTVGGLRKKDLMMSKSGKIVSKRSSAAGKKAYSNIRAWTVAVQKARKALGVKGFQAV